MKNPTLFVLMALLISCSSKKEPLPNFLIVLTDDQRLHTLGCYTEDCPIATPHIDGLAREGIRFSQGFVTTPICVCSRAGVLT